VTAPTLDLKEFMRNDEIDEQWATAWAALVFRRLRELRTVQHWPGMIEKLRDDLDTCLWRGELGGRVTAAHAWYALDLLDAGAVSDERSAFLILGHIGQLGLPEEAWQQVLDEIGAPSLPKPTMARFPWVVLGHLARQGGGAVLRHLYLTTPSRIRSLAQDCRRRSNTYEDWLLGLARLVTALWARRFLPLTTHAEESGAGITVFLDSDGRSAGAQTRLPGQQSWHPLAKALLTADQLDTARRDEVFCAEQFAHVFTSIETGRYLPEYLASLVTAVNAVTGATERLEAREALRLMRSRYEIPAYLFTELEGTLR